MKKIALLALSAVCVLALAGCNKSKGPSEAALKAAENGDYSKLPVAKNPATKKAYDFGGMAVTLYDWWSNPDAPAGSKAEEDRRAWQKYLMETYNFTYKEDNLGAGWDGHPSAVSEYCMTGGDDARILLVDGRSAFAGLAANLWADISKVPDIDWTKSKWNKAVLNSMPGYSFRTGMPEPRMCVFWNKRILQENGFDPDLPYDLQKEGKWTWEKFEELCKALTKDTDNDGIIDQYALSGYHQMFAWPAVYSNGGTIVNVGSDGKYYLDMSDNTLEAWEYTRNMFINYNKPATEGNNSWNYFMADFVNGETAFYNNEEYDAQAGGLLADMKDDWGMVCFPTGPKGDGKYFTLNNDHMLIIPSIYPQDKVNKILKIYDIITDSVPGYDDPDSWKESYYASFRDSRAVDETMQFMMDNSKPYIDWLVPGLDCRPLAWNICGGADVAETYESMKNSLQGVIDEAMNK